MGSNKERDFKKEISRLRKRIAQLETELASIRDIAIELELESVELEDLQKPTIEEIKEFDLRDFKKRCVG